MLDRRSALSRHECQSHKSSVCPSSFPLSLSPSSNQRQTPENLSTPDVVKTNHCRPRVAFIKSYFPPQKLEQPALKAERPTVSWNRLLLLPYLLESLPKLSGRFGLRERDIANHSRQPNLRRVDSTSPIIVATTTTDFTVAIGPRRNQVIAFSCGRDFPEEAIRCSRALYQRAIGR